jgi:hypothetical protein
MKNIWWHISLTFYQLKQGIINLIRWFPIIWGDREFDYSFLLDIMSFKMKLMSEMHRKHNESINAEEIAKQLAKCAELAKRISIDNYDTKTMEEHEEMMEKELDLLFSKMRKNIRTWW